MTISRVVLARHAGFCFGVRRAVETAEGAAPAVTLGPIIHNPQVVERLTGLRHVDLVAAVAACHAVSPPIGLSLLCAAALELF